MSTMTTEPLADDMITALRREAGAVGDFMLVAYCRETNHHDDAVRHQARTVCADAISRARVQDDSKPYVLVTP